MPRDGDEKAVEAASHNRAMAERLDQWAEITALAIGLRTSVLALQGGKEWAEAHVWRDMRESKEKEWTTVPS